MKKKLQKKRILSFMIAFTLAMSLFSSVASAEWTYTYEGVQTENVTKGVVHKTYQYVISNGKLIRINVMEVDLTNPELQLQVLTDPQGLSYKNTVTNILNSNSGAVAGVNADFFASETGSRGSSIGTLIKDGQLIATPSYENDTNTLGFDSSTNMMMFELFQPDIVITAPNGNADNVTYLNKYNPMDKISMYTRAFGTNAPDGANFQMSVVDGKVQDVYWGSAGMAIPENGYVLTSMTNYNPFLANNFSIGYTVGLNIKLKTQNLSAVKWAVGGGSILVKNGQTPSSFPQAVQKSPTARTCAGVNQEGTKFYLVTVDSDTDYSVGITLNGLSEFLISKGVYNAINFDGGGSTAIAEKNADTGETKLLNSPSDGSQRKISNVLGVVSTAQKKDTVQYLAVKPDNCITIPQSGVSLTVSGTDECYNPLTVDASKVSYAVSGIAGNFIGNKFYAKETGTAHITATYGSATASCDITVVPQSQIVALSIYPKTINAEVGQNVLTDLTAMMANGDKTVIDFTSVTTKVANTAIATSSDKNVTGVTAGSTYVTAKALSGAQVSVPIHVGGNTDAVSLPANVSFPEAMNRSGIGKGGNLKFSVSAMADMRDGTDVFTDNLNNNMAAATHNGANLSVYMGNHINKPIAYWGASESIFTDYSALTSCTGNAFMTLNTNSAGVNTAKELANFTSNLANLKYEKNIFIYMNNDPTTFTNGAHREIVADALMQCVKNWKNVFVVFPSSQPLTSKIDGVRYFGVPRMSTTINEANYNAQKQNLKYLAFDIDSNNNVAYRFVSPF